MGTAVFKFASNAPLEFLDIRLPKVGRTADYMEGFSLCGSMDGLVSFCLSLQDEAIGLEAAEALGNALLQMKSLRSVQLYLDRTNISDEAFSALCAKLGQLKDLTGLSVWAQKNGLKHAAADLILEASQNLQHLSQFTIEVQNNSLNKASKDKFEQLCRESAGKQSFKIVH